MRKKRWLIAGAAIALLTIIGALFGTGAIAGNPVASPAEDPLPQIWLEVVAGSIDSVWVIESPTSDKAPYNRVDGSYYFVTCPTWEELSALKTEADAKGLSLEQWIIGDGYGYIKDWGGGGVATLVLGTHGLELWEIRYDCSPEIWIGIDVYGAIGVWGAPDPAPIQPPLQCYDAATGKDTFETTFVCRPSPELFFLMRADESIWQILEQGTFDPSTGILTIGIHQLQFIQFSKT